MEVREAQTDKQKNRQRREKNKAYFFNYIGSSFTCTNQRARFAKAFIAIACHFFFFLFPFVRSFFFLY